MWSAKKSILLSKLCVCCFLVMVFAVAIAAPMLIRWLIKFSLLDLEGRLAYFYATIYSGFVPAAAMLADLYVLLQRISRGEVFVEKNVTSLRRISWCCFLGAFICLFSGIYYIPFLMVAFVAGFVGLIARVVKNVFEKALELQQEVDYTI